MCTIVNIINVHAFEKEIDHKNAVYCCGHSKELSQLDCSFEHSKDMLG